MIVHTTPDIAPTTNAERPTDRQLAVFYLRGATCALLALAAVAIYKAGRPQRQLNAIVADALDVFEEPPLPSVEEADGIVRALVEGDITDPHWSQLAPLRCRAFSVGVDASAYALAAASPPRSPATETTTHRCEPGRARSCLRPCSLARCCDETASTRGSSSSAPQALESAAWSSCLSSLACSPAPLCGLALTPSCRRIWCSSHPW